MKWLKSLALIALLLAACSGQNKPNPPGSDAPTLELGQPGIAPEDGTVLMAVPVENTGKGDAKDVTLTLVKLETSGVVAPTQLPIVLGDIEPDLDARKVAQLVFDATGLSSGKDYTLSITGTYQLDGREQTFTLEQKLTLPPLGPGSAGTETTSAEPKQTEGAPYPHVDPRKQELEENEPEIPPLPIGKLRGTLAPTNPPASPGDSSQLATQATPVQFYKNTALSVSTSGDPLDPSLASSGDVVFGVGNTFAVYSADGGNTFTTLDITKIFPSAATADSGGLCCDQIVQYVPSIRRFVWLMQDWPTNGPKMAGTNKIRIASASPEDIVSSKGTKWSYWDLSSATFDLGNAWMDYPSMAVGEKFLYIDINTLFRTVGGKSADARLVIRVPLGEIRDSQTIDINYFTGGGGVVAQNLTTTAYWSAHLSQSKMRVYSWPENSGSVSWNDVDINSWPGNGGTCDGYADSKTPGGLAWLNGLCTFPGSVLSGGATRRAAGNGHGEELWFAWSAVGNENFPHIHVQIAKIEPGTFKFLGQTQIWNPDHAWAYPALATLPDDNQTVGMAAAWGGNKYWGNHAVGFPGDPTLTITGTSNGDLGGGRWGDYFSLRPHSPGSGLFSTLGYTSSCDAKGNCGYQARYVLFGAAGQPLPTVTLPQANVTVNYKVPVDLTAFYQLSVPPAPGNVIPSVTTITSDIDGKIDTSSASFYTFRSQGTRHITIKVETASGLSASATLTLTAVNTAPSLGDLSAPATIGLGVGWSLSSPEIAADPNEIAGKLDCSGLSWSVAGSDLLTTETASNFGCDAFVIFGEQGSRQVTVTARDPEGLSVTKALTVNVTERPAQIPPTPKFIRVVYSGSSQALQPGDRVHRYFGSLTASVDLYNPDSAPLEYEWALFGPFGAFGFDLGTAATASVNLNDSKYNDVPGDPYCSDDGDNNPNTCRARFRVIIKSNGATVGVKEFPFIIDYAPQPPK